MKWLHVGITCGLIAVACAAQAAEPTFQFQKQIAAADVTEESLVAITLDADVFAATQPGFADIRLLDAHGAAVPFIIRKSQEVRSQSVRRHKRG